MINYVITPIFFQRMQGKENKVTTANTGVDGVME